ncbi:MAG: hypothetical protein ABI041_01135, partial [Bdellovibrionia bacterium]
MKPHNLIALLTAWALCGIANVSVVGCATPTLEINRSLAGANQCESYHSRPSILDVQAKSHPNLPKPWNLMKPAHLEAVAEILEMYPTHEIYFLARDAELLYDLAKLATQSEPEQSKRIHLLNISRANMRADHVKDYLEQEGISEKDLRAGKQILFVDTGFSGTIPEVIAEKYPEDLRKHLKTHLICSGNPKHPSTRTFLQHLNPAAVDSNPSGFSGTIISYEYLPRYTDRSDRFEKRKQWEPMSCVDKQSDGSVSKSQAQAYMEDLRYYAENAEAQELLKKQRTRWHGLMTLLREHSSEAVEASLKALLEDKDRHSEAIVRDFIEIVQRNHSGDVKHNSINPEKLGLKVVSGGNRGNKFQLKTKYPEWKSILEDPENGISKLFQTGDFQTLRSILDVIYDYEITILAFEELGKEKYSSNPETLKEIKRTIEGVT